MELSYRMQIKHYNKIFRKTVKIYQSSVKYIIAVVEDHWYDIKDLSSNKQVNYIENLIHNTKTNVAVYDFDVVFYKYPCYYRRSAIKKAIGIFSSYKSNYNNWLEKGRHGKPPRLQYNHNVMPVFYKGNCYEEIDEYNVKIKIFTTDWVWLTIKLRKSDVDYIKHHYSDWTKLSPALERKGKVWYLRFTYSKKIPLNKTKLKNQIVVGVDLNTSNHTAVCSAMNYKGTVLGRTFIDLPREKDLLNKKIKYKNNAISKNQLKRWFNDEPNVINYQATPRLWRLINITNKDIAIKTARQILAFALSVNADVIVFEHLDTKKKKAFQKEKLHLWCAKAIQKITSSLAHKNGIHVNTVCAAYTSKLAFDGSGLVKRGKEVSNNTPYNVCQFTTGKIYNCDLNATYNIGARYFIKQIENKYNKTFQTMKAKDPSLSKRSTCTLDSLIRLSKAI